MWANFFSSFNKMSSIDIKFRSLSKLAAECQRQVERLHHVDSNAVQKEVAELIKSSIRRLEQDIEVNHMRYNK